jgi:LuxR family maltose regulon positive regulatory protein
VVREGLNARLDLVFHARAAEVVGAAGSGKTTALQDWVSTSAHDVGWVTVTSRHRDLRILAQDLAGALPTAAKLEGAVELAPPAEAAELVAGVLERESRSAIVVIDNAERLDAAPSLDLLRELVALDRDSLRLVVAGRTIPDIGLRALRGARELISITGNDLRLDLDEATQIIRMVTRSRVDDETVAAIHEEVGGWALGTVLAGLALRDSDAPAGVAARGVASHRLFDDFFGAEIFGRLPLDIQAFLLDTCILELLDPDLCGHLTDRDDAIDVLRGLERDNVFTDWIGGYPPGFRYHAVFRTWLRARLDDVRPTRASELLRRAAAWTESRGRVADAIDFRLAAGDLAQAEALIVEYGPIALGEGRYEAMRTWIRSLPQRSLTSSAPLLVMLADAEHRLGNAVGATAARALMRDIRKGAPAVPLADHHELTVVVQHGTELLGRGLLLAAATQARRARSMIDLTSSPVSGRRARFEDIVLAMNVTSMASQLMFAGDWTEGARLANWVIDSFPADDRRLAVARARSLGQLAIAEVIEGSRFVADGLAREAIALCKFYRLDPLDLGWAELALLVAAQGDTDMTDLHRTIARRSAQHKLPCATCLIDLLRAWSYVRTGDVAAARQVLTEADETMAELAEPGGLIALSDRVRAIVAIGADEPLLRTRELEVLAALATGRSRRRVAEELFLSVNTVKTYARQAYRKLGVNTLAEAIARCESLGIALTTSTAASSSQAPAP